MPRQHIWVPERRCAWSGLLFPARSRYRSRILRQCLLQTVYDLRHLAGEVLCFQWIGFVVVEFVLGFSDGFVDSFPFDEAVAFGSDGSTELLFGVSMVRMIANSGGGIFEYGNETLAID